MAQSPLEKLGGIGRPRRNLYAAFCEDFGCGDLRAWPLRTFCRTAAMKRSWRARGSAKTSPDLARRRARDSTRKSDLAMRAVHMVRCWRASAARAVARKRARAAACKVSPCGKA